MLPSELIATPDKWTQGAFARNAAGFPVCTSDPSAACWCLYGVLEKCFADGVSFDSAVAKLVRAATEKGCTTVTEFNDAPGRTHAEIVAILKKWGL